MLYYVILCYIILYYVILYYIIYILYYIILYIILYYYYIYIILYIYDSASTSLHFCDPARWACCPRLFWNLNLDIKIPQGISCAISAHPRHSSAHPLATKCSGSQTRKAGAQGKWIGLCSKRPEDSGCVTACQGPMLPTSAWAHMLLSNASDS